VGLERLFQVGLDLAEDAALAAADGEEPGAAEDADTDDAGPVRAGRAAALGHRPFTVGADGKRSGL
jgi:hypothetical protein